MKVLQLEASQTVTVEEVFYDWLNSKLELKEISLPTYLCYETDFKRYHDSYAKHPIKEVSSLEIEHFFKNSIADVHSNTLAIRRTESAYRDSADKEIYTVKEYPKSVAGVCTVIIPNDYCWIIILTIT